MDKKTKKRFKDSLENMEISINTIESYMDEEIKELRKIHQDFSELYKDIIKDDLLKKLIL